jgi:hypothetical protein
MPRNARGDIDLVIHAIQQELLAGTVREIERGERQKTRARQRLAALRVISRGDQIARQLLRHETVVGLVRVEGINHIVAITERIRKRRVHGSPDAVRVAHRIQPMPRPALAKAR